jgi:mannose-1-phosphate guanylyltransferase
MIYAVIMAGGSGTRFWPKSTQSNPKQFLNLFGDRTMIQSTVDRLNGFIPENRCVVVTNDRYVNIVKEQLPEIPDSFIIGEPVARNTAPCVASAAQILFNIDPEAVMVVLPADHQIADETQFRSVLDAAVHIAYQENTLITVGITPNRPETGYGYIHFDSEHENRAGKHPVHKVKNFTEKPDLETAKKFLLSGNYLWNSGMFIWKASVILDAFEEYQREIFRELDHLKGEKVGKEQIDAFYHACPSISVDYGIMENADNVQVLPGDFGWNDVGSWTAVHELLKKNGSENAISASASSIHDSSGNLVHSESGKIIALVGAEHLAVVETEHAILVCDLRKSQDVKKVVEHLKNDQELNRFL